MKVLMSLSSFITLTLNRRWMVIIASFAILLAFASGMQFLTPVDVDFRNHFHESDPRLRALDHLEETYALTDSVLVTVAPRSGNIFTREVLIGIEDLTEALWITPYATRVDSISNYSHSRGVEDDLIVTPLIENTNDLSDNDIEQIQQIAFNEKEVLGRLISADGRVAGLFVSFALPDEDRSQAKVDIVDFLHDLVVTMRAKYPSLEFHQTGELLLNRAVRDALNNETGGLGGVAFGVMLLVAVLLLRSIWGTVAFILVLIAVIPSALGFVGWTGMLFYGESGAAIFVLMAITVAHCVHIIEGVLSKLRQGMERTQAVTHSLQVNTWPVFLTSLTTAIGFLSLNFSDMPPFRVMGNMVAFGSMCAFIFSVTLLPAFLSIVPIRATARDSNRSIFFDRFGRFVVSNHLILLLTFGTVVIILLAGISRIELEENKLEILNESFEFRQSTDFISENFGGLEAFEYSVDSGKEGGITDTEYLRQVETFADWYRAQPEVTHVFGVTDILKRLNKNLNGDDPAFYRIPDNPDLAAQYLLLYEFSLPVGLDLNNLINIERSATRLTVVLTSLSSKEIIELDERAKTWLEQNAPNLSDGATGVPILGAYSVQRNIHKMLIGTVTAMAIVSLLLTFVFKSIRFGLISLVPNFFPAAMAMGLWGYIVVEIGVAAAVVTAIAFGIIVDDTIHFMTKYLRNRRSGQLPSEAVQSTFSSVGRAIAVTTLIFALGFMVFGASGLQGNQSLGLLMVITVIVALLADFLFLPPLLMVLDTVRETRTQIRARIGLAIK